MILGMGVGALSALMLCTGTWVVEYCLIPAVFSGVFTDVRTEALTNDPSIRPRYVIIDLPPIDAVVQLQSLSIVLG